jgi:hypothetical protein
MKIKSVRRDAHEQADTCVLREREVCWSGSNPWRETPKAGTQAEPPAPPQ